MVGAPGPRNARVVARAHRGEPARLDPEHWAKAAEVLQRLLMAVASPGFATSIATSLLVEITTVETNQGGYDVFIGSTPIVQGNRSRGITIDRQTQDGTVNVTINTEGLIQVFQP